MRALWVISLLAALLAAWGSTIAAETATQVPASSVSDTDSSEATIDDVPKDALAEAYELPPRPPRPTLPEPKEARRLTPPDQPHRVWVDPKRRVVIVDGYVTLQEGLLEMFACSLGTKEHESVVGVESPAFLIHTALLAVGAKPGTTAQFHPQFRPPTGTEIEIEVHWRDSKGRWSKARAQDWVIDRSTGKPMQQPWVFAGSNFWFDERTGKQHYMAESGDMICVSNFSTAMLDVPIESSDTNEGLAFEANQAAVPELGTPVRLILKPKLPKRTPKRPASQSVTAPKS